METDTAHTLGLMLQNLSAFKFRQETPEIRGRFALN